MVLFTLFTALSLSAHTNQFSDQILSIGPMWHWNFGGEQVQFSWGIEVAYWDFTNGPHCVDFGFEIQDEVLRIYSEYQTGIIALGGSLGAVLEFSNNKSTQFGFQGGIWGAWFAGVNLRSRYLFSNSDTPSQYRFAPGAFLKIPMEADIFYRNSTVTD